MVIDSLRKDLCKTFCADISISEVPSGIAISGRYDDGYGDKIECFIENDSNGWVIIDDGLFIPDLIGRGIDIRSKSRSEFIERVLRPAGAFMDTEDHTLRTEILSEFPSSVQILDFLLALVRVRDVTFWTRERVKSTFKEDAFDALKLRLGEHFNLERNAPVDSRLKEFPADIVARPKSIMQTKASAIFLASGTETLNEALLLWQSIRGAGLSHNDISVMAMMESGRGLTLGSPKVQRAINRIDAFAVWDSDAEASVERLARVAEAA